mgnify:CR=1 FL=1
MADPTDVAATKMVRRELNKRMIDVNLADIRVMHGVCYIRGVVRAIKGGPQDVRAEIELLGRVLMNARRIRDCVVDVVVRT